MLSSAARLLSQRILPRTLARPAATTTTARFLSTAEVDDAPSAEVIGSLQDAFRADGAAAQAVFSSKSELTTGLRSQMSIRGRFTLNADEPEALGGTDTAPNPVEILLASLGSCQEITYKAYGQAMGLKLNKVSVAVDGHIDLRGFLAVDETIRPGFQKITGTVTIDSPESDEKLAQLKGVVDAHCPVLDMLSSVPTTIELQRS